MLSIRVSDKAVGVVFLLDYVDRICIGVNNLRLLADSFLNDEGCGELYIKKCKVMSSQDAESIILSSQLIIKEVIRVSSSPILLMLLKGINESDKKTSTDGLVIDIITKLSCVQGLLTGIINSVRSMGSVVIKYKDLNITDIFAECEFLRTRFITLKKQINLQYKSDLFEVDISSFMKRSSGLSTINSFIDAINKERQIKQNEESDVVICNKVHDSGSVSFIVKGEDPVKLFTQIVGKEFLSIREVSLFDAEDIDFRARRIPLNKELRDSFTHILAAMPILTVLD